MLELLIIGLVATLAFTISGLFGFGSGLLLTPLVMLFLPPKITIAVVTSAYLVSTLYKTILYWKVIDWKTANFVALSAAPATFIGSSLMVSAPSDLLKKLLAAIIVIYVLKELLNWNWRIKGKSLIALGSSIYGLITGLIGTASPIKAIVFNELKITKEGFVGAMSATALFMNIIKLGNWSRYSLIGPGEMLICVVMAVAAIIGATIGNHFVKKINTDNFRKGLLLLLLASAFGLMV